MAVEEKARVAKQYEDVVEIKASLSKLCGYGRWKLRLAKGMRGRRTPASNGFNDNLTEGIC